MMFLISADYIAALYYQFIKDTPLRAGKEG